MFESLRVWLFVLVGSCALGPNFAYGAEPGKQDPKDRAEIESFQTQVLAILKVNCFECHGDKPKNKGGLRLTSRASILKGGDSGPAVTLENPKESPLLEAIDYGGLEMPPSGKMDQTKIDVLTRWVMMGLPWTPGIEPQEEPIDSGNPPLVNAQSKNFWSFRPVVRPKVPSVSQTEWIRNPIDAFILHRLEENGLEPAEPAERIALFRRAHFDLTGLPPTIAEVDAFLADDSPDAFTKVVDRLLDSPRYGERWGRHWLDVVRFAETNSFERDTVKPFAWRYRDYVIDSFNADKPYDQFLTEQLAGDELDVVTAETIIATGFFRLGPWDDEPTDRLQADYDILDDILTTTSQAMLGLTINCARCHDHKLDPIPQSDYYRMLSFFEGIRPPFDGGKKLLARNILREIAGESEKAEYRAKLLEIQNQRSLIEEKIEAFESIAVSRMSDAERKKISKPKKRAAVLEGRLAELLDDEEYRTYESLKSELTKLEVSEIVALPQMLCVTEVSSQPPASYVRIRGNVHAKGPEVQPGFLAVLAPPEPQIIAIEDRNTSGRRLALAKWIASKKNPLTARVFVNRIWQHHFGRGIVRSPNNFGNVGDRPTHPELLDWLAAEFMAGSWRAKRIHRSIMTSSAYRMSSRANALALAKDPENDKFWRMNMRRLEAEEVRDTILAVSGKLNFEMGGPGVYPDIAKSVLAGQSRPGSGWGKSTEKEKNRRSIYIHVKRSLITPILSSFDFADTDSSCPVRFSTTQSTQALSMLNGEFMNQQAEFFGQRLRQQAGNRPVDVVKLALRLALARKPVPAEIQRGVELIESFIIEDGLNEQEASNSFCLMVLNLNEFLYLD